MLLLEKNFALRAPVRTCLRQPLPHMIPFGLRMISAFVVNMILFDEVKSLTRIRQTADNDKNGKGSLTCP